MVVRRIGAISCGKMLGCLYVVVGLIVGALFSLLALAGAAASGPQAGAGGFLFGLGAIIILPIFYGVIGFIGGVIGAALYNLVASVVGGIELEVDGGYG